MAPATKYVHKRVNKRQMRQKKTISCERSLVIISGISAFSFLFLVTILDSHSCWGHDQLGRMGKKSLQLEDDNKTSHCSQLRYTGNFFRAVSLVMR